MVRVISYCAVSFGGEYVSFRYEYIPSVDLIECALRLQHPALLLKIVLDPADKVILESAFYCLMEEIGSE